MNCKINSFNEPEMDGILKLCCSSKDEFEPWLEEFSDITLTKWVLRRTRPTKGARILYKGIYECQHHYTYPTSKRKYKTKSTECKASMIVTINRNRKEYRCRSNQQHAHSSDLQTTINVKFCHNHGVNRAEALKYRKQQKEVVKALKKSFEKGITPALALANQKRNSKEEYGASYHLVAADRACSCPVARDDGSAPCKHQAAVARSDPETDHFPQLESRSLNQKKMLINIASGKMPSTTDFFLPLTAEPLEPTEPIQPFAEDEQENEEDDIFDERQDSEQEEILEDNYAEIKEAEEEMEEALSILRENLKREINKDVKTLRPALKKFKLNTNRAKTQSQIVSGLNTFGKYLESTSAIAPTRKDINIPVKHQEGQD
ncbi:unnamed protein product [Meganyctiphanes norvegica]|uniref:SWIM-type domain-containing protein n=1 Tax=Meganyctiphanes norvegica TaxID=48144 RepID=A0AAV2STB7_MEGNR